MSFDLCSTFAPRRNTRLASIAIMGVLALATVQLSPMRAGAQEDAYAVKRDAHASTSGITSIRIQNGSGRLVVTGKAGASSLSATAVVRGSSQDIVNSVKLITERDGNALTVRADGPDRGWFGGGGWSADLTVEVPANIRLDVSDGSGGARLQNVGALTMRSGSGGVHIDGVTGNADVKSGSGGAELRNVRGDVVLSTGSGGITVSGVTGSVDVRSAGSGGVNVSQVTGSLHLGSIGSGSLTADNIGGDLTVDHKGSGSVSYTNVKGHVDVPSRGRRW
ncbi:MAG: hypothetical protein ACHQQP_00545 [Gemmatimonadales bacterium]|jgi:hypothetical protein